MSSTLLSSVSEHRKRVHGVYSPVVHGRVMSAVEGHEAQMERGEGLQI